MEWKGDNLHFRNCVLTMGCGIVIIGPSGSGKTTLLRCMNLLETPTSGSLTIGGREVNFNLNKRLSQTEILALRKQTGMVFQGFNLFPHMTALENVMEGQVTVLKRPKTQAAERAQALLEKVGLSQKKDSYPYQLSGGQQQRVAIARTMAMEPSVFLFDEPTSALDPELAAEVLKVMKDLSLEGMTMVVVTHKMSFARDVAHKIIFMDEGVILEEGSPQEFFNNISNQRLKQFLNLIED
ncbi:MAG TPA: amino acid ABC transporter ATP-binding protein [Desulfitobacterium sp.]|nr:amino acid ABC transporter ATP-binding protein [Desulfitobacterium sp.]